MGIELKPKIGWIKSVDGSKFPDLEQGEISFLKPETVANRNCYIMYLIRKSAAGIEFREKAWHHVECNRKHFFTACEAREVKKQVRNLGKPEFE